MKNNTLSNLFKPKILRFLSYVDGLSLIKKLFIAYITIFAIPIVIFGWLFTNNLMKNAETEALSRNVQDINQIRSTVLNNIELCKNTSQTALSTKNFLETISQGKAYSIEEILKFNNDTLSNVENILNINSSINRLRIFIKNENINEIYPCLRYESLILYQKWYRNIFDQSGIVYWRLNHPDDDFENNNTNSNDVVSLYREVKFHNVQEGVEEVNILSDVFYGNVYADTTDSNDIVFIIKGKNEEYWNHNSNFFKKQSMDSVNLKKQLLQKTEGENGNFKIKSGGVSYSVVYTYIRLMDTYVYKIMSLSRITGGFKKMGAEAIGVILLIIVAFSIVTYLITSVLLKKMGNIVSCMRRVQEGDMFVDIPIQGNDEIGELSRHFQIMLNKINELIFTVVKKQAITKDAEIRALHSQINAHFIYNVLESVKMMAVIDYKYEISDALTALGRLMRYGMNWRKQYVQLEDEIKHIRNYVKLLNLRFNNSIELSIEIDNYLLKQEILKMTLQPVVENAVNHGFEPKGVGGKITIKADIEDSKLIIIIKDDGVGMKIESLEELRRNLEEGKIKETKDYGGNGIGLANVNERIKLFFGKEFGLSADSQENVYTSVVITLPYLLSKDLVGEI